MTTNMGDASPDDDATVVEFFGVPRLLTGVSSARVSGSTLGALSRDLVTHFPKLAMTVIDLSEQRVKSGYIFVVNGEFTNDPSFPLTPGYSVFLVAADAGG